MHIRYTNTTEDTVAAALKGGTDLNCGGFYQKNGQVCIYVDTNRSVANMEPPNSGHSLVLLSFVERFVEEVTFLASKCKVHIHKQYTCTFRTLMTRRR